MPKPIQWCVIDAEGDVGANGLLGVAFYSDICKEYITDHEAISDMLLYHAQRHYTFVAHNAQYDIPVIFWQLGINMRCVYYNSSFNRGEWKYHPKKTMAYCWDSLDLSGGLSIAALGKAIGLQKLETPQTLRGIDPNKYEWICDEHKIGECIRCYALRDAEIVHKYLLSYAETLAQWSVLPQRRMAGAAMHVWKALDFPNPIKLEDGRCRWLGRQAYYGGRVECFKLGHFSPLYSADVASMYPSVMRDTLFPDPQSMVYLHNPTVDTIDLTKEGVAECVVTVPPMYCPVLPNAQNGKRIFGTGKQHGYWTFLELRYAMQLGCTIHQVIKACYGTTSLLPFTNFVGNLWALRQYYDQQNDPRKQTVKILLNSCYGRIGLRGDMECEKIELRDPSKPMSAYIGGEDVTVGNNSFIRYPAPAAFDNKWSNVIWAAQITSAARVRLHKFLMMQGDAIVYCDTDSVFSMNPIVGIGDGLGALVDPITYDDGWIVGPKLYSLTTTDQRVISKAKGVKREVALDFLKGNKVLFDTPVKPKAQMTRGIAAGTWIQVSRERHLTPHRRTPTNQWALAQDEGWSDTLPPMY